MNLDSFIKEFEAYEFEKEASVIKEHLAKWKKDNTDVYQLSSSTEKLFGNLWFQEDLSHQYLYSKWTEFQRFAINGIGGMTINERLYVFSLFERYESINEKSERAALYAKICAST
jgi:hypothetical protein